MRFPGVKRIDRYIIRKFLGTFFYSIILIISIAIVFDFAERLDDFIDRDAPAQAIIFDYYLNFIPYFVNLFTPLFVFISVIFFTSKMAQNTEIIAILNSGVSFKRLMWPYFLSALVIASFSFVLSNFVIPHSTERMFEFQKKYVWSPDRSLAVNIHRQVAPGLFVYLDNFAVESNIAYKFSMERFGDKGLEWKLMSEYAQYDTVTGKWNIHNYYTREFTRDGEVVTRGAGMDTIIKLAPVDFKRRLEVVEAMDYFRLNEFIDEQIMQGTENVDRYLVVKYQRMMNPLGIFVLTLIGVTVACRKIRGGIGMHIGIGLFLSFSYIMFMQVFNNLSISGGISPIIGVSIPTVSYLIIGMILYRLAPK